MKETLGGRRVLPATVDLDALAGRVRAGLPFAALEAFARRFNLPLRVLTAAIDLPERTLAQRKREGKLRADESARLYRVARIAALAEDILGETAKAGRWLRQVNRALGGRTPLGTRDTERGAAQVEAVLRRMESGVIS